MKTAQGTGTVEYQSNSRYPRQSIPTQPSIPNGVWCRNKTPLDNFVKFVTNLYPECKTFGEARLNFWNHLEDQWGLEGAQDEFRRLYLSFVDEKLGPIPKNSPDVKLESGTDYQKIVDNNKPGVVHHVESVDDAVEFIKNLDPTSYESWAEATESLYGTPNYIDKINKLNKEAFLNGKTLENAFTGAEELKFKATDKDTVKEERAGIFEKAGEQILEATKKMYQDMDNEKKIQITPFEKATQSVDAKIFQVREALESLEKTLTPVLLPVNSTATHGYPYPTPDKKDVIQSPFERWMNDVVQDLDGIRNWIADIDMRRTI